MELIHQCPPYGDRRIWALLHHRERLPVKRKGIYHIFKLMRWFLSGISFAMNPLYV